ncbi:MAG: hypothetical protein AAF085_13835 [Planctomycetota bacterium]
MPCTYAVQRFGRVRQHRADVFACAVENWYDPFSSPAHFDGVGDLLKAWAARTPLDVKIEPGDHDTPPSLDYRCDGVFVCIVEDHMTPDLLELPDSVEIGWDATGGEIVATVDLVIRLVYVAAYRRSFRAVIGEVI